MANRIKYEIDGYSFADSGVNVSKGTGLIDRPKRKSGTKTEWDDMNGYYIDLTKRKYEAREISLECFIVADGMATFANNVLTFLEKFEGAGLHELKITLPDAEEKPLFYHVFIDNSVSIDKTWSSSTMVGKFTLKLIEPEPVKMVAKWTGGQNVTTITSPYKGTANFIIRYSDGETAQIKQNGASGKTIGDGATCYLCIYGDLDEATAITFTKAEVIWQRL